MSKTTPHSISSLFFHSFFHLSSSTCPISVISNPTKSTPDGTFRMLSIYAMQNAMHACAPYVEKAHSLGQVSHFQSSHDVMLHDAAPSPISKRSRSSLHSVYMSLVARAASLWPGPTLAGRASAMSRHIPKSLVNFLEDLSAGKR